MAIYVRAHTRAGKMVKAHTRIGRARQGYAITSSSINGTNRAIEARRLNGVRSRALLDQLKRTNKSEIGGGARASRHFFVKPYYGRGRQSVVTPQRALSVANRIMWSLNYGPKRSSKRRAQLMNVRSKLQDAYKGR